MTKEEFNKKYQYLETITNVSQDFEITDPFEIQSNNPPAGNLIETEYGSSESEYRLIERETEEELITSFSYSDIQHYIKETLQLTITN